MKHRLYHARELPASLEAAWPLFDFPSAGWTLTGGGEREVGTRREIEIPGLGRIVDELAAPTAEAVLDCRNVLRGPNVETL